MPIKRKHDIIKLEVTIDNAVFVEVFEGKQHLCGIKLGTMQIKLFALDVQHQVTTTNVLHHEIHTRLRLETRVQIEKERMPFTRHCQEHTLFGPCTVNFVIFNNKLLLQHLDRV